MYFVAISSLVFSLCGEAHYFLYSDTSCFKGNVMQLHVL